MTTFFFNYKLTDLNNICKISSKYAYLYGVFDKERLQLLIENDKLTNLLQGKLVYFPTLSLDDIVKKINQNSSSLSLHREQYIFKEVTVHERKSGLKKKAYIIV